MFKRFWMVLRSCFGAGSEKSEDPAELEEMRQAAQQQMRDFHAYSRFLSDAISHRKYAARLVTSLAKQIAVCSAKANRALRRGDYATAKKHWDEVDGLRVNLEEKQRYLQKAQEAVAAAAATCNEHMLEASEINKERVRQRIAQLDRAVSELQRIQEETRSTMPDLPPDEFRAALAVISLVLLDGCLLALLLRSFLR